MIKFNFAVALTVIRGVHWIKPKHLHLLEQRTAIAIFKLATHEDANQIIKRGVFVEGKKVWGGNRCKSRRDA